MISIFRNCYFEYAGICSSDYNLKLYFIDDENTKFDSGGSFDIKTASLSQRHDSLFYRKDYSDKKLEFTAEICVPSGTISQSKLTEIKDWLFGQPDGWQKLRVMDNETDSSVFFYCCLIPNEDIADVEGVKGLRFEVKCNSPFAYKDPVSETFEIYNPAEEGGYSFDINVEIASNNTPVYLEVGVNGGGSASLLNRGIQIINTTTNKCCEFNNINFKDTVSVNGYSGFVNTNNSEVNLTLGQEGDKTFDYTLVRIDRKPCSFSPDLGFLELQRGINTLHFLGAIGYITITYIPTVRIGAF